MAGSCTWTNETYGSVKRLKGDWTSHTDGAVTSTEGAGTVYVNGQILRVEFVPDSGGTAPTDQYDCTILTADSIDVLYGQGANLSNASTVVIVSDLGCVVNDALSLTVANAGSGKGGLVYIYLR